MAQQSLQPHLSHLSIRPIVWRPKEFLDGFVYLCCLSLAVLSADQSLLHRFDHTLHGVIEIHCPRNRSGFLRYFKTIAEIEIRRV